MATKIKKGLYRVQVYIGTENGKRIYKSFYGDTKKEAEYNALVYKMGAGKEIKKATVTLRAAIEAYIDSKDGVLAMSTIINYRRMLNSFGDYLDTPLQQVNSLNLQKAITAYSKRTKENGKRISAKTVKNMYGLITAALHQNDIWPRGVSLPSVEQVEYNTPFDEQLTAIFRATKGTTIEIPVLLAACSSLRRSEVLGIKWDDIDYANKTITIRRAKVYVGGKTELKQPKTQSSKRVVFLPDFVLERIKEKQASSTSEYVCPISGNTITGRFGIILKKNNLPHCRFHDLRHAYVSVLTAHGVDKKYVQEMGGWSSDHIMNTVYKQTSIDVKRDISRVVNDFFSNLQQ